MLIHLKVKDTNSFCIALLKLLYYHIMLSKIRLVQRDLQRAHGYTSTLQYSVAYQKLILTRCIYRYITSTNLYNICDENRTHEKPTFFYLFYDIWSYRMNGHALKVGTSIHVLQTGSCCFIKSE